jgi:hypothetical protein
VNARRDLFAICALFLFLELAFIRWFPAEVLFLTFFTNTVLLASFLGLSLGCLAAGRRTNYLVYTPLLLVLGIGAGAGMESVRLALQNILDVGKNAASPQMVFFGSEYRTPDVARFVLPIEAVAGFFFVLIALIMIGPGQVLGRKFREVPNAVAAYMVNIGGSLAGVLLFNLCSWWLSPVWWFAVVAAGLVYFLWRDYRRPKWAIALAVVAPLLLVGPQLFSMGVIRTEYPQESWSPYYRVNYSPTSRTIVVNLLGHQNIVSRTDPYPGYSIPYLLNRDSGQPKFHDILIIGAGSGNDVSRALQWAAPDAEIDAVEIDPVIWNIGRRENPDHPYQDPRVTVHLTDGRNFLRSTDKQYDLIIFALVDSLVLHSSVSNIRLESYLFTKESFEDVRRALKPSGLFTMYNYFRQGWIVARLAKTVDSVFGQNPLVLTIPARDKISADQQADGFTIIFAGLRKQAIERAFLLNGNQYRAPATGNGFEEQDQSQAEKNQVLLRPALVEEPKDLRLAEDVWPFLYLRNPMIPDLSLRWIGVVTFISLALLWWFGRGAAGAPLSGLDARMFLLGAGFMLLETKAVVHMALIFGSTWIVNTVVFSALLVMILLANVWVLKRNPPSLLPFYSVLLLTLALNIFIPLNLFLGFPEILQAIFAGALVLSPVFCAGVIFAKSFSKVARPEQALAYNTAGAIFGGLAETSSLLIGFQWLLAVAGAIYVASWIFGGSPGPSRNRPE